MTCTPKLIIVGSGGHAVSVASVAISAGCEIQCFIDPSNSVPTILGYPVKPSLDEFDGSPSLNLAVAVGDNSAREQVVAEIKESFRQLFFPILIHRSATVSDFCQIGEGSVIMPGAVVGPESSIGKFCIINTSALIDHNSVMRDFSSLAPRASIAGGVRIGSRTAISIGASLKHGLIIGDDVVVGAQSYVNIDLPSNIVAYGTPARIVRSRLRSEPYLK